MWMFLIIWTFSLANILLGYHTLFVTFSFISAILFSVLIIRNYGFNSISFIFFFLYLLYGFSVPLSVLLNADIGAYRLKDTENWFNFSGSLNSFILINHMALAGMFLAYVLFRIRPGSHEICRETDSRASGLMQLAILTGLIASMFEFINFLRAGGITVIQQGKLIYQSSMADLSPTLPSELLCYVSFIFWVTSVSKPNLVRTIGIFAANSFYILTNIYIGERGMLMNIFIILFIGLTYKIVLKKIKLIWVAAFLGIYLLLASLAVYRNLFEAGLASRISFSVVRDFMKDNTRTLIFLLNPANSEYGTSCLNYRVYFEQNRMEKPAYGKTYLHVYSQLLPQSLNPFYDQSLTVQFRDHYFNERSAEGSIGGTAYSSLMEAYMNFREAGGFIMYLLFFSLILALESRRKRSNSIRYKLIYMIVIPGILLFHRSSFEYVLTSVIYLAAWLFMIILLHRNIQHWFRQTLLPVNP